MFVHIFGGKDSLCCSNYILKRTGRDNFGSFEASTIKTVLKLFYMDHFFINTFIIFIWTSSTKNKIFCCDGQLIFIVPIQRVKLASIAVTRLTFHFGLSALDKKYKVLSALD